MKLDKLLEFSFREARKRRYDPKQDPKVTELVAQFENGLISHEELRLELKKFGITHYENIKGSR